MKKTQKKLKYRYRTSKDVWDNDWATLLKDVDGSKSVPFSAIQCTIYRIGLVFTTYDECLIRAKSRTAAVNFVKKLYKHKATVQTGKDDMWKVDYDMLDDIGKAEIIDVN